MINIEEFESLISLTLSNVKDDIILADNIISAMQEEDPTYKERLLRYRYLTHVDLFTEEDLLKEEARTSKITI